MAELQLGANNEVVLYGIHDGGLERVKEQFNNTGIDLSPLYKPGGMVDIVRGMDHIITDPADPQWIEAVGELGNAVQSAKESIDGMELRRYELSRIGLAALNPDFKPPIKRGYEDGSVKIIGAVGRKYNFLSKQALTRLVLPKRQRLTDHSLENTSVVLRLTERDRIGYQQDPYARYRSMPTSW